MSTERELADAATATLKHLGAGPEATVELRVFNLQCVDLAGFVPVDKMEIPEDPDVYLNGVLQGPDEVTVDGWSVCFPEVQRGWNVIALRCYERTEVVPL